MKIRVSILGSLVACLSLVGCQFAPSTQSSNLNLNNDSANSNNAFIENDNATTEITYWLDYALRQCEVAPWGKSIEPETITQYYENTLNVTVYAVEVTPPSEGLMFCQACGCPTGTTVSIQTNAAGREILLDDEFTEPDADISVIEPVPQVTQAENDLVIDNTNTINTEVAPTVAATETTVDDASSNPDLAVATEDEVLSDEDAELQQRAEQVQAALADYYAIQDSYPNDLAALSLTITTDDLVYTPIGSLPADYYDLVVPYSTGQITVNPQILAQ